MPRKIRDQIQENQWGREFYSRNKEARLELNRARRKMIKDFLDKYRQEHPCSCGENHIACLQFHHLDPSTKEWGISQIANRMRSIKKIKAEISKCVVICANCHFKLHWKERNERDGITF